MVVALTPHFSVNIWGGQALKKLGKAIPEGTIGESWEVSAHPHGQSLVEGVQPLAEYAERMGERLYGDRRYEAFPLLIKFLAPEADLSVQVHPSDANALPGEAGKSEAWVVLEAEPNAKIVAGVHEPLEPIQDALDWIAVEKGDVIPIPPGMVHALTAHTLVYEVQQSSDTTFRLYDWGRPREMHLERGMAVIDCELKPEKAVPVVTEETGLTRSVYINNGLFTLEKLAVCGNGSDDLRGTFACYTVIEGVVTIGDKVAQKGQTLLAPAEDQCVSLSGEGTVLRASVR